ncbi:MAG: hypothetical protein J7L82_00285 [Staphylothermus sp.]|nr:hypothetical protein [Staphylothermus sp.]
MNKDLIIAVDRSENGGRVIAVVGADEHVLKSRVFGQYCAGLKHFRRVPSRRKSMYIRFFEKRFMKLSRVLEVVRIVKTVSKVNEIIQLYRPVLVIVDDKLSKNINHKHIVLESSPKPLYMDELMTIADNLANYFRLILKNNPKKYWEKLREFGK